MLTRECNALAYVVEKIKGGRTNKRVQHGSAVSFVYRIFISRSHSFLEWTDFPSSLSLSSLPPPVKFYARAKFMRKYADAGIVVGF